MKPLRTLPGLLLLAALVGCGDSSMDPGATMPEGEPAVPEGERIDFSRNTSFDGNVLSVDVGSDDAAVKLNTLRDAVATEEYRPPIPNHSGRSWVLRNAAHDSTSLVYALVSWDNDDPTDYLAAGWWVHVAQADPDPGNVERAIFIDGPEIDSGAPPTMPVTGQARYAGGAGGVVQYVYGADWGDLAGDYALGEYTATMTVVADFGDGTIAGCLGCVGDIEPERRHLAGVYEDVLEIDLPDHLAPVAEYEVHFAPSAYAAGGTFESTEARVTHPTRAVTEAEGFWGGSFSNVDDPDGHPRLVSGFSEAYFLEEDGSEVLLWGIFNALSEAMTPQ